MSSWQEAPLEFGLTALDLTCQIMANRFLNRFPINRYVRGSSWLIYDIGAQRCVSFVSDSWPCITRALAKHGQPGGGAPLDDEVFVHLTSGDLRALTTQMTERTG